MHASLRAACGVLFAAVGLILMTAAAASGAVATNGPDLSNDAAIKAYLQSIGVDPAQVTWQRGLNNYAGPSCPGAGWNCTTSTQVVQISQAGGQNQFVCEPEDDQVPPTAEPDVCFLLQSGPTGTNRARCTLKTTEEPTAQQECDITQTGDRNYADVNMVVTQTTGPNQTARQRAHVHQDATEFNQAQVLQTVTQSTSADAEQTQNAYQRADVEQTADGSQNYSHVHQAQDQRESGSATTQSQNADVDQQNLCEPLKPSQCATVLQTADGGKNLSQLHQTIGERQTTTALLSVAQQQGRFDGGQEGDVHQTNPEDLGQNVDIANEDLAQRQSAPSGAFQTQETDPRCCGLSQEGGDQNREDINQSTAQSATEADALQLANLFGEVHQTSGGGDGPVILANESSAPASQNTCDIDHHGRNNSGAAHFSVSGQGEECTTLVLETFCASGGDEDITLAQVDSPACTSDEGGIDSAALPPLVSLPTTSTAGLDIPMPSLGEPADFIAFSESG